MILLWLLFKMIDVFIWFLMWPFRFLLRLFLYCMGVFLWMVKTVVFAFASIVDFIGFIFQPKKTTNSSNSRVIYYPREKEYVYVEDDEEESMDEFIDRMEEYDAFFDDE